MTTPDQAAINSIPAKGLRRYLYEYMIQQSLDLASQRAREAGDAELTAKHRNVIRDRIADNIAHAVQGGLDNPDLRYGPVMTSINAGVKEVYPDQGEVFVTGTGQPPSKHALTQKMFSDFMRITSFGGRATDEFDARLPISPHDDRWRGRASIMAAGVQPLAITLEQLQRGLSTPDLDELHNVRRGMDFVELHPRSDEDMSLRKAGRTQTLADVSGFAQLRPYMTDKEASNLYLWAHQAARMDDGRVDYSMFMNEAATERAVAVLEDLSQRGERFTIERDHKPGQLKAVLESGVDVRIMDIAPNQAYVANSIYDRGKSYMYSINTGRSDKRMNTYVPTPEESVKLVQLVNGDIHVNNAYHTSEASLYPVGKITESHTPEQVGMDLRVRCSYRNVLTPFFVDSDSAREKMQEWVDTARTNTRAELNIEEMIALAEDPERLHESPEFSKDKDVAALQMEYWSQLAQLRPDVDSDGVHVEKPEPRRLILRTENPQTGEKINFDYSVDVDDQGNEITIPPIDAVLRHADAYIDEHVGQYDVVGGKRFNPVAVARGMDPSMIRENRNSIIAALHMLPEVEPHHLRGDDFNNDTIVERLVRFNPETAVSMDQHSHPQMRQYAQTIHNAVQASGADIVTREDGAPALEVDDYGVVHYQAQRRTLKGPGKIIDCQIGQLFTQDDDMVVRPKFTHDDPERGNRYEFVPGYEAVVVPRQAGDTRNMFERTRLRGFDQVVNDNLDRAVRDQLNTTRDRIIDSSRINSAYRTLYGHRFPAGFVDQAKEEGLDDKYINMILATESRRVHYDKEFGDGASQRSMLMADRLGRDVLNDFTRDALVNTGGVDLTNLHAKESAGRFDPSMTGTAYNHGQVRYLTDSAVVDADGFITPGDPDDRAYMEKMPEMKWAKFDPHVRNNMRLSAFLQASSVNENTNVVMGNFKGWTHDGGILISKNYADSNMIRSKDGSMRSLVIGDKPTDTHGNKGIIAQVIDPDMSDEDAAAANLTDEVEFFRNNRHVDVIMEPYSLISRHNAGTSRELMDSHGEGAKDVIYPDRVVEGGSGTGSIIITHMAVDRKTNIYDEEAIRAGKGRKVSGQLAIGLQSLGCTATMNHFFGHNDSNVNRAREFMLATGISLDDKGEVNLDVADVIEDRTIIDLGDTDLIKYKAHTTKLSEPSRKKIKADAIDRLRDGDLLALPFELELESGVVTPEIDPDPVTGRKRYGLPVLPLEMRSEQELHDGTISSHDFTDRYANIYMNALLYEDAQNSLDDASSNGEIAKLESLQRNYINAAWGNYKAVSHEIAVKKLEGKHNVFKEDIMTVRAENSATAVLSPDPRLKLNQLAMSSEMAQSLNVFRNGTQDCLYDNSVGHVLSFRDPVWTGSGVTYMEVVIDDALTGVAAHPFLAEKKDGDHDGDTLGLIANLPGDVHSELMNKASLQVNLLNPGTGVQQPDGSYRYDLSVSTSLDLPVSFARNPEFKDRFDGLMNNLHDDLLAYESGELSQDEYRNKSNESMVQLDDLYDDALSGQIGTVVISFKDMQAHQESVKECFQYTNPDTGEVITHNAKGNAGKMKDYNRQLGVTVEEDGTVIDHGECLVSPEELAAEQKAMGIKTESVGDAGTKSHLAVTILRKQGLVNEAAYISYGATQSILQAKKDPVDAAYREEVVTTAVGNLWKGYKMESSPNEQGRLEWSVARDADGTPVQATKDEWVQQYMDMYMSKEGMGVTVGRDLVEKAAEALSDDKGVMYCLDRAHWPELPEDKQPLALDQMAYGGDFQDLVTLAEVKANLFEGESAHFAPKKARQAMIAQEHVMEQPMVEDITAEEDAYLSEQQDRDLRHYAETSRDSITEQQGSEILREATQATTYRPPTKSKQTHDYDMSM